MSNEVDNKLLKYLNPRNEHRYSHNQKKEAYEQIVAIIGASKEVTEEWIEKKAKKWMELNWDDSWSIVGITPLRLVQLLEDFASSLVEEIGGK